MDKVNKLMAILGGETTIALHLEFLIRNNHADLLILKNTKVALRIVLHACTCACQSCIFFDVVNIKGDNLLLQQDLFTGTCI